MTHSAIMMDGNEAAGLIAYKCSEVIAIYPITPSSPMGEWADTWAVQADKNIWGSVPLIQEMQSEAGVAGAIHGALQSGALASTFTASQGLLLMIPNMYKIAGELTPFVLHVAARTVATHALSIFGDHSDVMAARGTGFAMLASGSVQEAMDVALISHAATLEARIPFLHFFDGFRTSHEIDRITEVTDEHIRAMIREDRVSDHRKRALSPDHPVIRGTAQNPDVFFQAREAANGFYDACPGIVQKTMNAFTKLTGRSYHLFDYHGAPDAERLIVIMGSGAETAHATVDALVAKGEKVGVLKVRLYRPFDVAAFSAALPASTKTIAVLDRTKEPGAVGEPLYQDVVTALTEARPAALRPTVIGGRYGLSSKEFTPAMVKAVFDELKKSRPKNHFTVGIDDDVTHLSLPFDPQFSVEPADEFRALFYGLGADGTVSANKSSIKIIGEHTTSHAQAYFVYDSKKSGSTTVSHLRFGPHEIRAPYLIGKARFVGCHQFGLLEKFDVLEKIENGGTLLVNSAYAPDDMWHHLPVTVRQQILSRKLKVYTIDAYRIARDNKMGGRINTIMQVAFFALSDVLPKDKAIAAIKESIQKAYGKKGEELVQMNFRSVDQALENLHEMTIPAGAPMTNGHSVDGAMGTDFFHDVLVPIIQGKGDELAVSKFPVDGTFPLGTARFEKRNIAQETPVWDEKVCIQCGKCAIVCPHAVIRIKAVAEEALASAPAGFKSTNATNRAFAGKKLTLQISGDDCTGCGICVDICPAKNKTETRLKAINMTAYAPNREQNKKDWAFFQKLPNLDRREINPSEIRANQLFEPLFEFSGACAGCGETPYIKLMSQLFGDRALIANATGCSSIYGGNLPTTPWAQNSDGRGPAWSNSLFEDNAEFGLGFRLSIDKQQEMALEIVRALSKEIGDGLAESIRNADQSSEAGIFEQRERVALLRKKLTPIRSPLAGRLMDLADALVRKSVWIVGGDGWAYDIGFGGLDHVLAQNRNVNILVLDTEVYSNTGGQASKSTPCGAVAKFAAGGKPMAKKDLGLIAMTYGHVYVASVAMGARDEHTVRAFLEAEAYPGPSLIIAYSHCIAHGINMTTAMREQKNAVQAGYWPLYRFNPTLREQGKNPLQLDSPPPSIKLGDFMYSQNRFKMLTKSDPENARLLLDEAQTQARRRRAFYEHLAAMAVEAPRKDETPPAAAPTSSTPEVNG